MKYEGGWIWRARLWTSRIIAPSGYCVLPGVPVSPWLSERADGARFMAGQLTQPAQRGDIVELVLKEHIRSNPSD